MAVLHGSDIAHATQSGGIWALPLQGAIGRAAPLAQEGDHLIHHRDKVHPHLLPASCIASTLVRDSIIA